MHSAGFELAVPANKLLQTNLVDRTANGIGRNYISAEFIPKE
jgi:hypothetical protein